ncbi:MAG: GNAT family N-acetyltransferase [Nisaea sp.]|uniref:GNAT family N-acetyltransferase n=1 Tax=Nisaea sp. TaxID=2024842 RepID=UPI001B08D75D|nr:GNAT family N-acetyltransferase [Nisaea sp.]MBO6561530.1 GNAT family N-acetyltransferase [Nisaea sp.]
MSNLPRPKPKPKAKPLPVTVRQAEERDKPRMVEIMDQCWEATWMPFMPPAVPARYRNENLGQAFVDHAWQTCRVAEADDGKTGIVGFSFLIDRQIKTIQILPEHQRRGVGRALLVDAEAELAKAGHAAVYVECDVFNARAAVFYRAMGYEETGRIDTDILGYKVATHVFEKKLGDT